MTTKLTLSVDRDVIADAKTYAEQMNTSVSQLVERYLKSVIQSHRQKKELSTVERLRGTIKLTPKEKLLSDKELITSYLEDKYL